MRVRFPPAAQNYLMPPKHLAIIMDGNRRWATERGLPKFLGHTEGGKNVKTIALASIKHNIKYLTLWALSTENLKERSEAELAHLFSLFTKLLNYLVDFLENNVQLNTVGDLSKLPVDVQESLNSTKAKTAGNSGLVLTLAVNYGGRDEILRAVQKTNGEPLSEEQFSQLLDTKDLPDVDLIIRTGGHQRLSGFMPWQSTYAELYFTPIYWPAFDANALRAALDWYEAQQINHGK